MSQFGSLVKKTAKPLNLNSIPLIQAGYTHQLEVMRYLIFSQEDVANMW